MTSGNMEVLVGRTLDRLLREQRLSPRDLERRLDLPGDAVDRLLAGHGSLDMDLLRRVLTLIGVAPESFFARLFADRGAGAGLDGGDPGGLPAAPPGRQQVAGLIDRVRAALAEIRPEPAEPSF